MTKPISSQMLFTLIAVFISFAALFVSIQQSRIMKEQTELMVQQTKSSAWPHLDIVLYRSFGWENEEGSVIDEYKIAIQNKGTGPAILEGIKILYDGKTSKNWNHFFELTKPPKNIELNRNNSTINGQVIAAGEEIRLVDFARNYPLRSWVYEHGDKISLQICYKSVFDDHWILERDGFKTNLEIPTKTQVEGCNFDAEELFME